MANSESVLVRTGEIDSAHQLGNLLVRADKLSARDLERAVAARLEMGGSLAAVLVQLGLVSESDVVQTRSVQLGVPFASADDFPVLPVEAPGLLPEFLSTHACYPLRLEDGRLDVAMATPEDQFVLREAVRDVISDTVYRRQKHPFLSPPATLNPEQRLSTFVQDTLRGPVLASIPYLDQKKVVDLLDRVNTMDEGSRVANDQVLMLLVSACVLHERFHLAA